MCLNVCSCFHFPLSCVCDGETRINFTSGGTLGLHKVQVIFPHCRLFVIVVEMTVISSRYQGEGRVITSRRLRFFCVNFLPSSFNIRQWNYQSKPCIFITWKYCIHWISPIGYVVVAMESNSIYIGIQFNFRFVPTIIEAWTKWLTFRQRDFQRHFKKCICYFDSNVTQVCSNGSNWQTSIGLGMGLVPNWR